MSLYSVQATQASVPMFVRGLAQDAGITVVFGKSPAYDREHHVVYLPPYATFKPQQLDADPSLANLQEAVRDLFQATGLHEIGHPMWTSGNPADRPSDDFAWHLWMSLEDVRCDSLQQRRLAGAKLIFEAGYGRLIKMGYWGTPLPGDTANIFTAWVLYRARAEIAGQRCFADLAQASEKMLVASAGPGLVARAWSVISRVAAAASSRDVLNLVFELLALLDGHGVSTTSPAQFPVDVCAVLDKALLDVTSTANRLGAKSVAIPRAAPAQSNASRYGGDGDTRPLSIRLTQLLLAQSRSNSSHDRRGSRADPRMLSRVPLGVRDVFLVEGPERRVDTVVEVLLDRSQSMSCGGRIALARRVALRVCIALSDVQGTKVGASAFPEQLDGRGDQVRQLLPIGADPRAYACNFLSLDAPSWARTPMAPALLLVMAELLRRPQPRKIAVVVTDGDTDSHGAAEMEVIDQMRRTGIQVLGLGIGTMANADLFDAFAVVSDIAELEQAMFTLLQNCMLSRLAA